MIKLTYILLLFSVMGFAQNPAHIQVQLGVADNSPKPPQDKGTPLLTNFRVEDANKDRVYFDASNDVTGLTTTGFVISGKTISSVTIDGDGLGGYFTVSTDFTFWDNNTIRLGEIDDNSHRQTTLYNFSLQYIDNNIAEPTSTGNTYYVTTSGSNGNSGTSEGNAWATIDYAASQVSAGDIVYIKAGNYGSETIVIDADGTATNPIKFIGYKTTPNDINSMYYSYGDGALDSSEMPLLSASGSSTAIDIDRDYIIVDNIQIDDYNRGIFTNWDTGVVIRNSIAINCAQYGLYLTGNNGRIENSLAINNGLMNFNLAGIRSLIRGCESYCNDNSNATDYYYSCVGGGSSTSASGGNIYLNNYAKRDGDLSHTGHGLSIEGQYAANNNTYNLVQDFISVNTLKAVELRHAGTAYNVVRGLVTYGEGAGSDNAGAIMFRDGANNNLVENGYMEVTNQLRGIYFIDTTEYGNGAGSDNIVKNNVFRSTGGYAIQIQNISGSARTMDNNLIYNNTFYDFNYLIYKSASDVTLSGNEFKNNNVVNVDNYASGSTSGWSLDYNNFYGGMSSQGSNATTYNPNFVDTTDFEPQNDNLITAPTLFGVEYDYNGDERDDTTTTIGSVKDNDE